LESNDLVFSKYSAIEAEEKRDIPDLTKYQELVDELFPARSDLWRKRMARRANDVYWTVIARNYPIRKNARETLSTLKSMGLQLGVVSNHHNHEALLKHLNYLGILSRFTCVVSSAKTGIRKPDSRIFKSCLSSMGTRYATESMFVGDSLENDVEGARSAGMRTVLIVDDVTPGDREQTRKEVRAPDFSIRDLAEIPGIVSSHSRPARPSN